MHPSIREARSDDLAAINEIYNHYVLNTTATFHEQLVSAEDRQAWWREHANRFPILVADADDEVLGWAALSPHSGRCAYRLTVEDTIYLRPEACGKGLGHRLLSELLERGRTAGFHSLLAVIGVESEPSIRLHAALGFREVGRLREVGLKFGRWLDVLLMQRGL